MYFPKLFNLLRDQNFDTYSGDLITKIDDYLGSLDKGSVFIDSDLNLKINDVLLTDRILKDLTNLEIISEYHDEVEDDYEGIGEKRYLLLIDANRLEDKSYQEYLSKKRKIDSFSVIYEKTKKQNSGALTLIDLKGYSKNVNSQGSNVYVLALITRLQEVIDASIKKFFLNKYSGIEVKHNGDGWFFYFLAENDAYEFLENVFEKINSDLKIKTDFTTLGTALKSYIHHAREIEKIYKVDTLHFDMEGKDVILIHMLEKPIEKALYDGVINKDSNFIAITETVLDKINPEYSQGLHELTNLSVDVKDSEGNMKVQNADIKVFYKEIIFSK